MNNPIPKTSRNELKNHFFDIYEESLQEMIRADIETCARKGALKAVSGVSYNAALDVLVKLDIDYETLVALALVPVAAVAWADGPYISSEDRQDILAAAEEAGLDRNSAGYQMLSRWLVRQPDREMIAVWKKAIASLVAPLGQDARYALQHDFLGRARDIAQLTGSFFGIGGHISQDEQRVLDELEQAFVAYREILDEAELESPHPQASHWPDRDDEEAALHGIEVISEN